MLKQIADEIVSVRLRGAGKSNPSNGLSTGRLTAAVVLSSLLAAGGSAAEPRTTLDRSLFGLPEIQQTAATGEVAPVAKPPVISPAKPAPGAVKPRKKGWQPLSRLKSLKKYLPTWKPRLAPRKPKQAKQSRTALKTPPGGAAPVRRSAIRQLKYQASPRINLAAPPNFPPAPKSLPPKPIVKPAPALPQPPTRSRVSEQPETSAADLETLMDQIESEDASVRNGAAVQLAAFGSEAKKVLPVLEQLTYDKSADVRASAAQAVWKMGGRDKIAAKTLLPLLEGTDEQAAAKAARLLGDMKEHGRPALAALREKLANSQGTMALELAEAIAKIDPADSKVIDRLVEWLADGSADVQSRAAAALAATDLQHAGRVVEPLVSRLGVDTGNVGEAARQTLSGFLTSEQPGYTGVTAYLLGNTGAVAAPLLPELRQLLADRQGLERLQVAEAIVKIEPGDAAAVDVLVAALSDDDAAIRCQAAYALASVSDQHFDRVYEPLKSALEDGDGQVRSAARQALGELEFGGLKRQAG